MGWFFQFWRRWVYDDSLSPRAEWRVHPHKVYKIGSRLFAATLGSIVPFVALLLKAVISGSLRQLADQSAFALYGIVLMFTAIWLIAIIVIAASDQDSLVKYVVAGTIAPANLSVVSVLLQMYE